MVTYGPWVQADDYVQPVEWDHLESNRVMQVVGGADPDAVLADADAEDEKLGSYSLEPYVDLPDMLVSVVNSTAPAWQSWVTLSYGGGEVLPGFVHVSRSEAVAGTSFAPVIPGVPNLGAPSGYRPFSYWPPDHGAEEPEGWVDIEFEGGDDVSEWLEVYLDPTTQLQGSLWERYDEGDVHTFTPGVSGPFSTEVKFHSAGSDPIDLPSVYSNGSAEGLAELPALTYNYLRDYLDTEDPAPVRLTEYLNRTTNFGALAMQTVMFIDHSMIPEGGPGVWVWSYGWGWDITKLIWTLRPPRYRWVFDSTPYRRITQRADGLAGGARRVHPRPKSIQGSNRRAGGVL